MKGIYVFKQNGIEIGRSENLITTAGKAAIAKAITLQNSQWAGSIAIGAGTAVAVVTDDKLQFEYDRGPINSISVGANTPTSGKYRLTAKATLGENTSGIITEAGLFSSNANSDRYQFPIFTCDDSESWDYQSSAGVWAEVADVSGYVSVNGNAGNRTIYFNTITSVSSTRKIRLFGNFDFSEMSPSDYFSFALQKTGGSAANVTVRFYTDETNYFEKVFTAIPLGTNTYQFIEYTKSSFTTTLSPDWSNITFIEINNPEGNIYLDAMRVKKLVVDDLSTLVSRSIINPPITKTVGTPLEVEYYLDLF